MKTLQTIAVVRARRSVQVASNARSRFAVRSFGSPRLEFAGIRVAVGGGTAGRGKPTGKEVFRLMAKTLPYLVLPANEATGKPFPSYFRS
jgi:hypothetical protein